MVGDAAEEMKITRIWDWKEIQGLRGSGLAWETAFVEKSFSLPPACHFSSLYSYPPSSHPFSSYSTTWEKAGKDQGVLWSTGDQHLHIFLLSTLSHVPTSSWWWPTAGQAEGTDGFLSGRSTWKHFLRTTKTMYIAGCCACDGESPAELRREEGR